MGKKGFYIVFMILIVDINMWFKVIIGIFVLKIGLVKGFGF